MHKTPFQVNVLEKNGTFTLCRIKDKSAAKMLLGGIFMRFPAGSLSFQGKSADFDRCSGGC